MRAEDWDRRYAERDLVWSAGPNRFLVEQLEALELAPGRALDVAAGEGRNAIWLAEHGWTVTAIDFSRVGIGKAEEVGAGRGVDVMWLVGDVTVWEPPPRAFDLVLVFYLQLAEPDRRAAHARAAAAVAPGGVLLIVGHDRDNLERGVGGPPSADVLLTTDGVRADLEGTGLTVEVARQVDRPVETEDGGTSHAIDCLVRARRAP